MTVIFAVGAVSGTGLSYGLGLLWPTLMGRYGAAYGMVTGFTVAGVYAVGMLRGRRDRYHRMGFLIPFWTGAVAAPIQVVFGDTVARTIADQPSGPGGPGAERPDCQLG